MPDHHDLLIEALTALITDLVDERMAAFMEANLDTIVQDAIADVPVFEIADYAEDIERIVTDVISQTTFTTTADC
jgi:DNA topoisomerase IA